MLVSSMHTDILEKDQGYCSVGTSEVSDVEQNAWPRREVSPGA